MATRKKDWSLTDRLLKSTGTAARQTYGLPDAVSLGFPRTPSELRTRDSQDRQGRFPLRHHATPPRTANPMAASARGFSTPILHGGYPSSSPRTANPAALASVRGPNSRAGRLQGQPSSSKPAAGASPDRVRERTRSRYGEETYSQADVTGLGLGETKSGLPTPASARQIAKDPSWRPGSIEWDNPGTPTRRMAMGGPPPSSEMGKVRRTQSTESAFRSADASMFNSTVTPKAAPIRDYKPRGKVTKDKNIQAFY